MHMLFLENKLMMCLYQHKERAPKNNETNSYVRRPLGEPRKVFGVSIKMMEERQLVGLLIHDKKRIPD